MFKPLLYMGPVTAVPSFRLRKRFPAERAETLRKLGHLDCLISKDLREPFAALVLEHAVRDAGCDARLAGAQIHVEEPVVVEVAKDQS